MRLNVRFFMPNALYSVRLARSAEKWIPSRSFELHCNTKSLWLWVLKMYEASRYNSITGTYAKRERERESVCVCAMWMLYNLCMVQSANWLSCITSPFPILVSWMCQCVRHCPIFRLFCSVCPIHQRRWDDFYGIRRFLITSTTRNDSIGC